MTEQMKLDMKAQTAEFCKYTSSCIKLAHVHPFDLIIKVVHSDINLAETTSVHTI